MPASTPDTPGSPPSHGVRAGGGRVGSPSAQPAPKARSMKSLPRPPSLALCQRRQPQPDGPTGQGVAASERVTTETSRAGEEELPGLATTIDDSLDPDEELGLELRLVDHARGRLRQQESVRIEMQQITVVAIGEIKARRPAVRGDQRVADRRLAGGPPALEHHDGNRRQRRVQRRFDEPREDLHPARLLNPSAID